MQLNKTHLVLLLALLALIKWFYQPLIQWQNTQLTLVENKLQQRAKMQDVITNQSQYQENVDQVKKQIDGFLPLFFGKEQDSKVSIQQRVEQLLNTYDLTMESFDWVLESESTIQELRVKVRFNGQLVDFARLNVALKNAQPAMFISDMRLRRNNPRDESIDDVKGEMTIVTYRISKDAADV